MNGEYIMLMRLLKPFGGTLLTHTLIKRCTKTIDKRLHLAHAYGVHHNAIVQHNATRPHESY